MHKTAYEMRISDWSSDVCSSDLSAGTFTEYSLAGGKFFLTSVYNDTTYHYMLGRESDFTLVFQNAGVFNNDAHRNWRSEGRRVGKDVAIRIVLGVRRIIKKKKN